MMFVPMRKDRKSKYICSNAYDIEIPLDLHDVIDSYFLFLARIILEARAEIHTAMFYSNISLFTLIFIPQICNSNPSGKGVWVIQLRAQQKPGSSPNQRTSG